MSVLIKHLWNYRTLLHMHTKTCICIPRRACVERFVTCLRPMHLNFCSEGLEFW